MSAPAIAWPAKGSLTQRELFLWFAAILFATKFFQAVVQVVGFSITDKLFVQAAGMGAFQLLAWFAVFRLLWLDDAAVAATRQNVAVVGALGVVNVLLDISNVLPAQRSIWIVATLGAIYLFLISGRNSYGRAAAVVLMALSAQSLWGPVLFSVFALDFLHADAALVGAMLDATRTGYTWHGNVIATQGHSIEIYSNCSSFHNISLAVLCWVTVTKLHRPNWIPSDFLFGAAAVAAMIATNVARLYVAALGPAAYEYWHNGFGAHIFQAGVSAVILIIALWGANAGVNERKLSPA